MLPSRFEPALTPPADSPAASLYFVFRNGELLLQGEPAQLAPLPAQTDGLHYLGQLEDTPCYTAHYPHDDTPEGCQWVGLRASHALIGNELFQIAGRASQILEWDRSHRFCGVCGNPTRIKPGERARECTACGHQVWPRISPAMMVLVRRGKQLLMARGPHFPPGVYSALAGFVEAGESLEQTVHREVREEVGVRIHNLRYFHSQSWPFPHSLMLAFTADYLEGELTPDQYEIEDARWFDIDDLPNWPFKASIAHQLLSHVVAQIHQEDS